jgi:hypothetical protein
MAPLKNLAELQKTWHFGDLSLPPPFFTYIDPDWLETYTQCWNLRKL